MLHQVLAIGEWVIDFLFAEERYDRDGVLACLYEIDAPSEVLEQADEVMRKNDWNCGFMYGSVILKRAVVVVGPSSSGSEFLDTLVHEIHHLAVLIASGLGVDLESETPAYLAGDSVRELAEVICEMGCSNCHCGAD